MISYVLIVISLTQMPSGSYGIKWEAAPVVSMQEFKDAKSCEIAKKTILSVSNAHRKDSVRATCVEK